MKIKKLQIHNFKVFHKVVFSFETPNLIMLDGPNGFGKTTLFDAIELLLTGQIRRYLKLGNTVIKGSQKFTENPFYNLYGNGEDIVISAEIEVRNETRILERRAIGTSLPNSHTFESYQLYEKLNFNDQKGELVSNEVVYLEALLGKNYKENFEFLNYVEQEDSIYLLKNKDKDKENNIAHLFNTERFEYRIKKLTEIKDKLLKLCDKPSKDNLDFKKVELETLKNQLASKEEVQYTKLFESQEYDWDRKELSFATNRYSDLLDEDGVLTKIKDLVAHKESFLDYKYNLDIDKLVEQHSSLENLLRYLFFLDKKDEFNKEKELQDSQRKFQSFVENLNIDIIKSGDILLNPEKLFPLTTNPIFFENFNSELELLEISSKELSELSNINTNLVTSRNSLVTKFSEFHKVTESIGECVLCGYNWEEVEFLHKNIEKQTEKINSLIDTSSHNLATKIEKFKDKYLFVVNQSIVVHTHEFNIDIDFIDNLNSQNDQLLNSLKLKIDSFGIDLNNYLNTEPKIDCILRTQELITELTGKKRKVDNNALKPFFNDIHAQFFALHQLNLNDFNLEQIQNKINYINWQHSLFQSSTYRDKSIEFLLLEDQYKKAKEKTDDLKKLIDIYRNSLKKYNQKLIDDIEILFHIYSGRIVQDFQGGLGLFISNKNGLKFQTDPSKSYDAVFSMSSGQLSALIISFTLALNKKYSKNKILFIDDPVQTMDEINIVGFIELLRNEFSEHQIFMSTHEDMMSTFMRYKFKKYGLSQKRINVREISTVE
ncbi:AAA family ATPase [Flavobacterium adhaerens]|uniref:AAA family ATPase n=1 Tax=Flavobacterium adhaerens TaxID=3149043 RepID=UPI0032B4524A